MDHSFPVTADLCLDWSVISPYNSDPRQDNAYNAYKCLLLLIIFNRSFFSKKVNFWLNSHVKNKTHKPL